MPVLRVHFPKQIVNDSGLFLYTVSYPQPIVPELIHPATLGSFAIAERDHSL